MSAEQRKTLLVVPGFIANDVHLQRLESATSRWRRPGFHTRLVPTYWDSGGFESKLQDMMEEIDYTLSQGDLVQVLGVSAGGTLAIASLINNPKVEKAVTVSSRLHAKQLPGSTSTTRIRELTPAAFEGIAWIQEGLTSLSPERKSRILNTRAYSGDKQVPPALSYIEGAINVWMPPAESHSDAVKQTLTENFGVIVDFLTKD